MGGLLKANTVNDGRPKRDQEEEEEEEEEGLLTSNE